MNRLLTGSRRYGRFAAAVVLVACVTAVAAGTGQGRTDRAIAPRSAQVTTISLAHWSSSTVETQLLRQVLAAFKKRNPQIRVNELVLDPYPTQMLARFAAGRSPDVFYVDSQRLPRLAQAEAAGAAERLGQAHAASRRSTFFPRLSERLQGRRTTIYGFPKDWSPLGMEINTSDAAARPTAHGADRPGRSSARRSAAAASTNAVPDGAPLCLSPGLGAHSSPSSTRTTASFLNASEDEGDGQHAAHVRRRRQLLRRLAQETVSPGRRTSSASAGAVRRSARRRPRSSSRATGLASIHGRELPERAATRSTR